MLYIITYKKDNTKNFYNFEITAYSTAQAVVKFKKYFLPTLNIQEKDLKIFAVRKK